MAKIHVVYRGGDYVAASVTVRGDRRRNVHQVHHGSAEHVAERVRVVRQHDFNHLRLGVADRSAFHHKFRKYDLMYARAWDSRLPLSCDRKAPDTMSYSSVPCSCGRLSRSITYATATAAASCFTTTNRTASA